MRVVIGDQMVQVTGLGARSLLLMFFLLLSVLFFFPLRASIVWVGVDVLALFVFISFFSSSSSFLTHQNCYLFFLFFFSNFPSALQLWTIPFYKLNIIYTNLYLIISYIFLKCFFIYFFRVILSYYGHS